MAGHTQPGGKVEQVLTDQDIDFILGQTPRLGAGWGSVMHQQQISRAVEAAVLAKITRRRDELDYPSTAGECREYLDKLRKNYVTEREAQERVVTAQRDAYRKGFLKAWEDARACVREKAAYGSMAWDRDRQVPIMDTEFFNTEPEYIYPDLPTKRVPREVRLSDGRVVGKDADGLWLCRGYNGPDADRAFLAANPLVLAKTPADARLLADLVERPYDEVPDVWEG